jgi:hypothetical protein
MTMFIQNIDFAKIMAKKNLRNICDFKFPRPSQTTPRWPKSGKKRPKKGPRPTQDRPRPIQDRPRRPNIAPRRPQDRPREKKNALNINLSEQEREARYILEPFFDFLESRGLLGSSWGLSGHSWGHLCAS